jgi:WD40-like Beta Propeller Repeat
VLARWAVLVLVSACSFTPGALTSGVTDSPTIEDDANPTVGWTTPTLIAGVSNASGNDDPSLTNDLLELYFGSTRDGGLGGEDIWVAKRASVDLPFGTPEPVTELNSQYAETTMKVTGLGKSIYFASTRGGTGMDIYVSTRAERDQAWSTPAKVNELSTAVPDWAPFAQSDQLRIVICSGSTEAQEALFASTRTSTSEPWGALMRIDELDEPAESECDPNEPRSGALYYSTDHLSTDGTFDIYRASRISSGSPFGNRTAVSAINVQEINDRDPWVSPDERTMVFASDRDGVNIQLYITTR